MASVLLSPVGVGQQYFDNNGVPLAGGLIFTYQAGTSTPLATYTDNGGTVANANPIVLDSAGRVPYEIWMFTGYSYKFVIQSATATSIQTLDNLYPILQNAPTSASAIPSGGIILWSGSTGSVPSGWYLCDGTNGTPDLRNSFIVGAGNTYAVGATGGTADAIVVSHTHTATSVVTDPGHVHTGVMGNNPAGGSNPTSANVTGETYTTNSAVTGISVGTTIATAGTSGTGQNLPPYYALAYIMKA
jgi:microcystin-dependent protein